MRCEYEGRSHTSMIDRKKIKQLQKTVWEYYNTHGRHSLPWRKTKNPYHILVSEVMLQQTQVVRVVPMYREFLKRFPTIQSLATAPLRDVLVAWQGLGYNRRAQALHKLAGVIMKEYKGSIPTTYEILLELPGIGPYTASAVSVFAYNTPFPMVETNIRTVFFYHLFTHQEKVSDTELLEVSRILIDSKRPREWYWALMDYGAYLKGQGVRSNMKSKHYTPQSIFKGSDREVRGAIVCALSTTESATLNKLVATTKIKKDRIQKQIQKLHDEGLIQKKRGRWLLP